MESDFDLDIELSLFAAALAIIIILLCITLCYYHITSDTLKVYFYEIFMYIQMQGYANSEIH